MVERRRPASDTNDEAQERTIARLQSMSPGERALLCDQLSIDVTRLALAGIRAQHPGLSRRGELRELARRRYGDGLADAVYGPVAPR